MKVIDLIQWLKENTLHGEVFVKNIKGKRCSGFYGLESFLNGENTGSEHTVLLVFDKNREAIKANNLIMLLEEKNPVADIYVTEKDSEFYYKIQGLESSPDKDTMFINFSKMNKSNKVELMHFSNTDDTLTMEKLFSILGNRFSGIRALKTNGKIDLYCVDVVFGKFTYTGKTLIEALKKAVANIPQQE